MYDLIYILNKPATVLVNYELVGITNKVNLLSIGVYTERVYIFFYICRLRFFL